jgi:hypothetical protein
MPEAAFLSASSDLKVPIRHLLSELYSAAVLAGRTSAQFFGFTRQPQQIARLFVW